MISAAMILITTFALIIASGFFMLADLEEKYKNMEDEDE